MTDIQCLRKCFNNIVHSVSICLIVMCLGDPVTSITMEEYFPEIGNDLTTVTWGHAINNKELLQEALEGNLMMLEADVVLGTLIGGTEELIPVMAHPPDNASDLSLNGFISRVLEFTENGHRCGIKLDFKTIEAFIPSIKILQQYDKQMDFPVLLNADILPGPVNSTTKPVDADSFLELCVKEFPTSTLSIGWTTRFGGLIFNGSYSEEQVQAMEEALQRNNVTQPVTFPVRAGLAARSAETLTRLKNNLSNCTFTIWSSQFDPVNVDLLRSVILDTLGRDRTFVDVPKSLSDQLNLNNSTLKSSAPVSRRSSIKTVIVSIISAIIYKLSKF